MRCGAFCCARMGALLGTSMSVYILDLIRTFQILMVVLSYDILYVWVCLLYWTLIIGRWVKSGFAEDVMLSEGARDPYRPAFIFYVAIHCWYIAFQRQCLLCLPVHCRS